MRPKLILCLAFALSGVLCGCTTPHGVSLSKPVEQIRASILKITPLGTPFEGVKMSIHTKIHPDSFYYDKHANGLPGTGVATGGGGPIIWDRWPLGGEHHGKEIGCQIGSIGIPLWNEENVCADWVFDDKDRLADVFVYKTSNLP
jgi:hypothetical protein